MDKEEYFKDYYKRQPKKKAIEKTSKYRGVSYDTATKKYRAGITIK